MPTFVIPILIVAVFGVIVLAVILVKRHAKVFKSDEKPKSDKEIAAEELDRILEPIEEEMIEKKEPEEEEEPEEAKETPKE